MLQVVTPYGREGPSSRVRVFEWLDRLSADAEVSSYVSHRNASPRHLFFHPREVAAAERRLRAFAARREATLLLHREASPLSRGSMERRLLERPALTVYDFDDALHCDNGSGSLYRRLAPKAAKATIAVRTADLVVAGNAVLAEWASSHNSDVRIIPSCVDPRKYRQKETYTLHDPPRLVWLGSADNERYLLDIAGPLLECHRRFGARLELIGTPHPQLGPLETMIDRVAWSERVAYETLRDADLGIGPVPDEPYERGKSGYKLLQYGVAGLPVIADPVGVNRDILAAFGAPAPADAAEWADALAMLLSASSDERASLGRRARATVEEGYSYQVWAGTWSTALGL